MSCDLKYRSAVASGELLGNLKRLNNTRRTRRYRASALTGLALYRLVAAQAALSNL